MQGFKCSIIQEKYQRLGKAQKWQKKMINGINVYNCEERGEKLASCSLERTRLEEIIIEVSKTLLSLERGEP